jgi:tRNA (cytidine/uridine-2'-O-)-methyltransferase
MRIALYEPEIAGNVGAVLRLGACLGVPVDLIEPMGFAWDDARVRRTAMDYIDHVVVTRHQDFASFRETIGEARLILLTTKAEGSFYDARFEPSDILLFGRESAGVPLAVADACDMKLKIPTVPGVRSLNMAMAAGIAASEALRQLRQTPVPA